MCSWGDINVSSRYLCMCDRSSKEQKWTAIPKLFTCLFRFAIHYSKLSLPFLMQPVHLGPLKPLKGTRNVSSVPSTAAPPTRVPPIVSAAVDTTVPTLTLYRCHAPVCRSLMLFYVIYSDFDSLFGNSDGLWSTKHSEIGFSQYRW